eukprot:scaffold140883_cov28-Tisochrysis_lutea.AAC.1
MKPAGAHPRLSTGSGRRNRSLPPMAASAPTVSNGLSAEARFVQASIEPEAPAFLHVSHYFAPLHPDVSTCRPALPTAGAPRLSSVVLLASGSFTCGRRRGRGHAEIQK